MPYNTKDDGRNRRYSDEDYDRKYQNLLTRYGLKRDQSDFEKDIAEYKSKLDPELRAKLEGKAINVSQDKNGSAVAEINEEKIKRTEDAAAVKSMSYPSDKRDPDDRGVTPEKKSTPTTKKTTSVPKKKVPITIKRSVTKKNKNTPKKEPSKSLTISSSSVSDDAKYWKDRGGIKEKEYEKGEKARAKIGTGLLPRDEGQRRRNEMYYWSVQRKRSKLPKESKTKKELPTAWQYKPR